MAFPTINTRRNLASGLEQAQEQALSLKTLAAYHKAQMAAGPVTSGALLALLANLKGAKGIFTESAGLAGMDAFAQGQLGAGVASDFTAMMNAIDAAGSWIITNFPKDGSGYLLSETMNGTGDRTERLFTSAQTAGLRTLLDTLISTIN